MKILDHSDHGRVIGFSFSWWNRTKNELLSDRIIPTEGPDRGFVYDNSVSHIGGKFFGKVTDGNDLHAQG